MQSIAETVYETLNGIDALRSVASFATSDTGVVYLREDVEFDFPVDKQKNILREVLFEAISVPVTGENFDGELHTTHVFDDKLVLLHSADENAGIFVSLDRTGSFDYREIRRTLDATTTQSRT